MDKICIKDLSKAAVLAALYNNSRPLGLGLLQYEPKPMTEQEAQEEIDALLNNEYNKTGKIRFDYLKGRVIKADITDDSFSPALYDRDNGAGAAKSVIETLRLSLSA